MLEHEKHALPLPESLLKRELTPNFTLVESALEWQESADNHSIICFDDPDYPSLLKQITSPPPILFVKGELGALYLPSIAIVGSRAASRAGLQLAYEFGKELGGLSLSVCSGMAAGIDGSAHQGCIDSGGKTLAVLGTGVDVIYPKRHRKIYESIQTNGAITVSYTHLTLPTICSV